MGSCIREPQLSTLAESSAANDSTPAPPDGGYPKGKTRGAFTLIAPFTSDASRWFDLEWINLYEDDGKIYRLARPGQRMPSEAEAKTYGDIVSEYRWHPEAKSLAPDGRPCGSETRGLLRRASIVAGDHRPILKETDRMWEHGEAVSVLDPRKAEISPTRS